jgi:hypothetical protein
MAKQKSHYVELSGAEMELIKDEKLFLQELLRILDTPTPNSQTEQEQKKENYENTKEMMEGRRKASEPVEAHEEERKGNVEKFKCSTSQVKDNKTRGDKREDSDAEKIHTELDEDRAKVVEKELEKGIKLCKEMKKKLDKQTKQRQVLAEKLRLEKMQRETKERKLMNGIKRCESLERKMKYERKTYEHHEEIIEKESYNQQRLKEDSKTVISHRKLGQQKLTADIKLIEQLRNDEDKEMVNFTAKEKLKGVLECAIKTGEEKHEAEKAVGLQNAKPRQTEVLSDMDNSKQARKHEDTQKDSLKDVSRSNNY